MNAHDLLCETQGAALGHVMPQVHNQLEAKIIAWLFLEANTCADFTDALRNMETCFAIYFMRWPGDVGKATVHRVLFPTTQN